MRSTVTVIDPVSDISLIALSTAKVGLGLKMSDRRKDDAIKLAIRHASADCNGYCRRPLRAEKVEELFELDCERDTDVLVLKRNPIIEIDSVIEGDDTALVLGTDYRIDKQSGMLTRLRTGVPAGWSWRWIRSFGGFRSGRVKVTYTAGFSAIEDVDPDVERACLELVKANYTSIGRDPIVRSVNIPEVEAVTYAAEGLTLDLPADVRKALNRYRRVL